MQSRRINTIIDELVDQYAFADKTERPWIIGFSGGKDSTALLTLVWEALEKVKQLPHPYQLRRPVYVVCNDTMVENPIIQEYVDDVLIKIQNAARKQQLPIIVEKTMPKIEQTYWVNVLGKGYPVPNNTFRWCTDKLKISPTTSFITEQVNEKGDAIILIGARKSESLTRSRSLDRHEIKGKRLTKHPNHHNLMVYAPIKDLLLDEIWSLISSHPSPWGYDNALLRKIYEDANADDYECPTVVTDDSHTSCGKSRFGCWTCTVVKKDKSMSGLIKSGESWMKPLLQFRDSLMLERNISENRLETRRSGQIAITEDGHKQGNYTPEYRARKLRELLEIQKKIQAIKPYFELITNQELIAIQVYWYRDGIFDFKVSNIYSKVFGTNIYTENVSLQSDIERQILKDVCQKNINDFELINNLLAIQHSKTLLLTKFGLQNDIENQIELFIKRKNED